MSIVTDTVVIGGGIAGVSVAYHLTELGDVVLVEAEPQLAYHTTGRSAAVFVENYGASAIRSLSAASRSFFTSPPPELTTAELVRRRGVLWIGRPGQEESFARLEEDGRRIGSRMVATTPEAAVEQVPFLVEARLGRAVYEPDPLDLDVAAVHQAYLGGLRRAGGEVLTGARVTALSRNRGRWTVTAGTYTIDAGTVVNAAGAWGDEIAFLAGVEPIGLVPMRRTAFMVAGDGSWADLPMVIDVDHEFYVKPDGPQLLCSPADETPDVPGDARPDPLDVALAIERINEATTLAIRSVRSEWAGLRTFAPDRAMVIGPEPTAPEFVWLVGQGGTGIQTAPAAAELAASLVAGKPLPSHLAAAGVKPDLLAVERLR